MDATSSCAIFNELRMNKVDRVPYLNPMVQHDEGPKAFHCQIRGKKKLLSMVLIFVKFPTEGQRSYKDSYQAFVTHFFQSISISACRVSTRAFYQNYPLFEIRGRTRAFLIRFKFSRRGKTHLFLWRFQRPFGTSIYICSLLSLPLGALIVGIWRNFM
jgi:hypothetical protein